MYNIKGHKNISCMVRGSNCDRHKTSETSRPALGSTQPSIQCETVAIPRRSSGRWGRVLAQLRLVSRFRMTADLLLLRYMTSWRLWGQISVTSFNGMSLFLKRIAQAASHPVLLYILLFRSWQWTKNYQTSSFLLRSSSFHYPVIILLFSVSCSNHFLVSVDKKNQLDVTFCIFYFSSNSCSTCFGQPCAHHQELTIAWCYSLVLVCAVAAGRWSSPVGR